MTANGAILAGTGLPNQRLFLDRLEQEIKHAKRINLPVSVFFLDLKGYKEVNDEFGHEAGGRLLAEVADRLTHCVREEDTVARPGIDEFTVILTGIRQRKDIEHVAQEIIDALMMSFPSTEMVVRVSVSIGIAFYPQDASTSVTLMEAADLAMFKARNSSSNWMCFQDTTYKFNRHGEAEAEPAISKHARQKKVQTSDIGYQCPDRTYFRVPPCY